MQSEVAAHLNHLARPSLLNLGYVSALNNVIMDYFTSRDEGSDDEVTKEEESDDSMHRCTNKCAVLAFLNVNYKVHYSCYLNRGTRGDQKFRDSAHHEKQWKTVLFRVMLVCLCNDAVWRF